MQSDIIKQLKDKLQHDLEQCAKDKVELKSQGLFSQSDVILGRETEIKEIQEYIEGLEEVSIHLVKEMSKVSDYNKLFADLQKDCDEENVLNAFSYISLGELIGLNFLLDRLILFCENVDQEELEDCECGDKVLELYRLADTLFTRTSRNED